MAWVVLVLVAILHAASASHDARKISEDAWRNTSELISSRGYSYEQYNFHTSDGYILPLYRIPCSRSGICGGPPVLMVHGLLCSSDVWVMDGLDQSLGYVLSEQGFDVWLLNKRGNIYSKHRTLTENDAAYWSFTYDEIGSIDIAEQIDFILAKTNYSTLGYVGHSEGTTTGFVAVSSPAVAAKVNTLAMLAPIANLTEMKGLFGNLAMLGQENLYKIFGHKAFFAHGELNAVLIQSCHICPTCCLQILFSVCGEGNFSNYDYSRVPVWVGRFPAGSSMDNMAHWVQGVEKHTFGMFDMGEEKNVAKYGSKEPPFYDLSNLPMPVWLFTGGKDYLATPNNVQALVQMLPADKTHLWNDPELNHADWTFGSNMKTKVYPTVIQALRTGAGL